MTVSVGSVGALSAVGSITYGWAVPPIAIWITTFCVGLCLDLTARRFLGNDREAYEARRYD